MSSLGSLAMKAIKPIVESCIKRAIVEFKRIDIKNLKDDGFDLYLEASLTETGPFPATITFNGLNIMWCGFEIATLKLSNSVSVRPRRGGDLKTPGTLTITDPPRFAEFLGKVLKEESFLWTIKSPNLGVSSVKIPFKKIAFSKDIKLKAFNGLHGISLQKFQLLPGDVIGKDPSIKVDADVTVVSESQLSIFVGKVRFRFSLGDSIIGEFWAEELKFPANGGTRFKFLGHIVKPDLSALGILVSKFLTGEQQTLKVQATNVDPQVDWLSSALRNHALHVSLDGEKRKVIQAIEFSAVSITGDRDHWKHASSTCMTVTYINPFGFSFRIVKVDVVVALGYQGVDEVAKLNLKGMTAIVELEATKDRRGTVRVGFENEILNILNPKTFGVWRDDVKRSWQDTPVRLRGTATVVVDTPVRLVTITDLPFDFPSCKFKGVSP